MATYPEPFAPRNPFQGMSVPDYGTAADWEYPGSTGDNDPWNGGDFEVPSNGMQPAVQQPASKVAAADPTASVTRYGGGNQNVDLRNLDSYRDLTPNPMGPGAMKLADPDTLPAASRGIYGSAPDTPSQITRNPSRSGGSVSGGGSSYQQQLQTRAPMQAMKAPELPKYEGIGEYKPPEEDPNVYKTARREAMGAGMRELRDGTREAISSGQSLDNPNARSKFIQQALQGYGKGLENVASGAAREGRAEAGRKRSEQLSIYKANYDVRSSVYLTNYQNQINKIAQDFASEQAAQMSNWNAGINQGAGASSLQYLNSSRPSAGYTGTNGPVRISYA